MKRWLKRIAITIVSIIVLLAAFVGTMGWLASRGHFQNWALRQEPQRLAREIPEITEPARAWEPPDSRPPKKPAELYSFSSIWSARLSFTAKDWKKITPSTVPPVRNMMRGDGRIVLNNPKASRSGLSGVVGIDFNWAPGTLEMAGST